MQQANLSFGRRATPSALLSLTHPNKEFLQRHGALLRRAIPAGFPSPADDYVERRLNLDEHLIEHKDSTFFMRVAGDSMRGVGISDGDLLVVDRSLPAMDGCVVIAVVDGEFTVKQLRFTPNGPVLHAAHPDYPDIPVGPEQDFSIWGVVKWSIHKV
ncbi:MAG: peptidase S24 [Gallionellales bacterium RIFCSPLOWO2_12_FULL_59_22]|nr:MAG: peptidase S24 [Gallionellales bacterium RIFCSPLOWO2_02_FULL_59_110]OGT04225.1 MAG: peptidase S24 [Gallionellales bacterium RIFCSPLOWO2_02_58_13]OGT11752.1 MAG: peptidase S24 [Gallionellales bacterium RIFCSPLOWO2_12_FULL_59_22]